MSRVIDEMNYQGPRPDDLPCQHENAEFYASQPNRIDEPGYPAHWHCPDCDAFLDEDYFWSDDT